jgi:dTDP-4-dehydrorhamnose reductase
MHAILFFELAGFMQRVVRISKTMLRLAKEKEKLSIINDQFGAPTGAELLATLQQLQLHGSAQSKTLWNLSFGRQR